MDLTSYVATLQNELSIAAGTAGEDTRVLAERLTASLDSAARLVLLEALSAAADEITRELAPGSVEVRLRGRNPSFVVTPPPTEESFDDTTDVFHSGSGSRATDPRPSSEDQPDTDEGTSRINLRLPDSLKLRAEEAAGREGLSVNAWLVRAVVAVLESSDSNDPSRRRSPRAGERYTGWVR
jgi:HicB family